MNKTVINILVPKVFYLLIFFSKDRFLEEELLSKILSTALSLGIHIVTLPTKNSEKSIIDHSSV